ncbi:unnamed protein product [Ilex paraguariensis]|uniref:Uncharacterized protein n=1 Tax=Ilex paraguariensis TaxID=185542 RepID=A0ABC8QVF4_9AQUA
METELKKLKTLVSFKQICHSTTNIQDLGPQDHGYTSLKDIIPDSPPCNATNFYESNVFHSSSISIRNELVKHAASAYVQSAFLTNQNQNCLANLWENITNQAAIHSCWNVYVQMPLRACFGIMFRFLDCIVNGFGRVSSGRIAIA